jgi:hypothetical protein
VLFWRACRERQSRRDFDCTHAARVIYVLDREIKALIVVNDFLEAQLEELRSKISTGYARGLLPPARERKAVKALIVTVDFLEAQVAEFRAAVSNGYSRGRYGAERDRREGTTGI